MPDTPRTVAALQTLFGDNTTGDASPQDLRDFLVSVMGLTKTLLFKNWEFDALSGSPVNANVGSTANAYEEIKAWAFDGAANEYIQTLIRLPADWNGGAVTVSFLWAPSTAGAGNVRWAYEWVPLVSGTTQVDIAPTLVAQNFATPAVADQFTRSTFTTTLTPTSNVLKFNVLRNAADAGDTYNALDAWFLGLELQYTSL